MENTFYADVVRNLQDARIPFERDVPLSKYATFRIGGPADLLIKPLNENQLIQSVRIILAGKIRYFILGNGSNTLFDDRGFRGAVILTKNLNTFHFTEPDLTAGAGASVSRLSAEARNRGLSGLNFACGIPGSLGGALAMNAGCYGSEMKDCFVCAKVLNLKDGTVEHWSPDDMHFRTRMTRLLEEPYLLLSATIHLTPADRSVLEAEAEEYRKKRVSAQPLEYPSAGSVFKRTEGKEPTAMLIDRCGLKGLRIGDAEVSLKHAGFIVNRGAASANDVLLLIAAIQKKIQETYGFVPEPEIRLIEAE